MGTGYPSHRIEGSVEERREENRARKNQRRSQRERDGGRDGRDRWGTWRAAEGGRSGNLMRNWPESSFLFASSSLSTQRAPALLRHRTCTLGTPAGSSGGSFFSFSVKFVLDLALRNKTVPAYRPSHPYHRVSLRSVLTMNNPPRLEFPPPPPTPQPPPSLDSVLEELSRSLSLGPSLPDGRNDPPNSTRLTW